MNRWTLALVVSGVVPFAAAQSTGPLPPLTAQVEVHVVNVDVSVTDSNGPVGNLTKDDFEILEDGKLQKITNFAIINSTTEQKQPAAVAQNATADNRRRMLLIIDNNYLSIRDRNRALDTIEKYLDSSFNGEWAVATVGHAVDMLQPFTTDKALIHTALAKARKMGSAEEQSKIDRSDCGNTCARRFPGGGAKRSTRPCTISARRRAGCWRRSTPSSCLSARGRCGGWRARSRSCWQSSAYSSWSRFCCLSVWDR